MGLDLNNPLRGWTYFGQKTSSTRVDRKAAQIAVSLSLKLLGGQSAYTSIANKLVSEFVQGLMPGGSTYYLAVYYIDYGASAAAGGDLYIREMVYYYRDYPMTSFIKSETKYFWSLTYPIVKHEPSLTSVRL